MSFSTARVVSASLVTTTKQQKQNVLSGSHAFFQLLTFRINSDLLAELVSTPIIHLLP